MIFTRSSGATTDFANAPLSPPARISIALFVAGLSSQRFGFLSLPAAAFGSSLRSSLLSSCNPDALHTSSSVSKGTSRRRSIDVLFRDENFIVVNKPFDVVTQAEGSDDTVEGIVQRVCCVPKVFELFWLTQTQPPL
jgi:23S rRNA-/tRNA-specific pseudouridylate synthase